MILYGHMRTTHSVVQYGREDALMDSMAPWLLMVSIDWKSIEACQRHVEASERGKKVRHHRK